MKYDCSFVNYCVYRYQGYHRNSFKILTTKDSKKLFDVNHSEIKRLKNQAKIYMDKKQNYRYSGTMFATSYHQYHSFMLPFLIDALKYQKIIKKHVKISSSEWIVYTKNKSFNELFFKMISILHRF